MIKSNVKIIEYILSLTFVTSRYKVGIMQVKGDGRSAYNLIPYHEHTKQGAHEDYRKVATATIYPIEGQGWALVMHCWLFNEYKPKKYPVKQFIADCALEFTVGRMMLAIDEKVVQLGKEKGGTPTPIDQLNTWNKARNN